MRGHTATALLESLSEDCGAVGEAAGAANEADGASASAAAGAAAAAFVEALGFDAIACGAEPIPVSVRLINSGGKQQS